MNSSSSCRCRAVTDLVAMLARWLLGAFFIYMGLNKALHPVDFLKLVRQYELVQSSPLLNSIAIILPWFEIFCGLLLLAGVAVRGAALMLVLMLVPFTVVVVRRALALQAARHIPFCAVKFDCGCGGGEVFICRKVLENLLFLGLSLWLLAGYGRSWCVRYALASRAAKTNPSQ
jgi:uncharacterized membrane protein YphA (DoxX/SURF4 family)